MLANCRAWARAACACSTWYCASSTGACAVFSFCWVAGGRWASLSWETRGVLAQPHRKAASNHFVRMHNGACKGGTSDGGRRGGERLVEAAGGAIELDGGAPQRA